MSSTLCGGIGTPIAATISSISRRSSAAGDHELELIRVSLDPLAQDRRLEPRRLVPLDPLRGNLARLRRGVAQLGAERSEIARDAARRDRARRLDGDVLARRAQRRRERRQLLRDHRLAAGEHHVRRRVPRDFRDDFGDRSAGSPPAPTRRTSYRTSGSADCTPRCGRRPTARRSARPRPGRNRRFRKGTKRGSVEGDDSTGRADEHRRNTGFQPVRPAGFQPAEWELRAEPILRAGSPRDAQAGSLCYALLRTYATPLIRVRAWLRL